MNVYLLGSHDGELPTHLLRDAESEHGIFAMGRLSGDQHTMYYAASVADSASVGDVVGTVEGAGSSVATIIVQCVSETCLGLILWLLGVITPCHVPGPPEWVVFLVLRGREELRHLEHALERLGRGHVAAAYDGDGTFLVELAADDRDLLDEVASTFAHLDNHEVVSTHWMRGSDLQRV